MLRRKAQVWIQRGWEIGPLEDPPPGPIGRPFPWALHKRAASKHTYTLYWRVDDPLTWLIFFLFFYLHPKIATRRNDWLWLGLVNPIFKTYPDNSDLQWWGTGENYNGQLGTYLSHSGQFCAHFLDYSSPLTDVLAATNCHQNKYVACDFRCSLEGQFH